MTGSLDQNVTTKHKTFQILITSAETKYNKKWDKGKNPVVQKTGIIKNSIKTTFVRSKMCMQNSLQNKS